MRLHRVALCLGLASCALFPSLDGLTDGSAPDVGASDVVASDVTNDVKPNEAGPDVSIIDASDAGDATDAATCGFPGPTTGLVAYYPFEEGSGTTVHDCSPNHLDGTFVTSTGSWTTGKKGGGLLVQSPNGCVDFGTNAAFQPAALTLAVWVDVATYPTGTSSGYVAGQSMNADVDGWRFGSRTSDAGVALGWDHTVGSTHFVLDAPGPATGTWHHFAITFDGSTLQIFVDGALSKSATGLSKISYDTSPFRVGCRADGNNVFAGSLDEVRFYSRVLTQNEITSLAQ